MIKGNLLCLEAKIAKVVAALVLGDAEEAAALHIQDQLPVGAFQLLASFAL